MTRFGFGTGFGLSDIFGGVATEIFTANVANNDGSSRLFQTDNTTIDPRADFTASIWFKCVSFSGSPSVIGSADSQGNNWRAIYCQINTNGLLSAQVRNTADQDFTLQSPPTLTTGVRYNITWSHDYLGKEITIYLNSVALTPFTYTGALPATSHAPNLTFGGRDFIGVQNGLDGTYFNGMLLEETVNQENMDAIWNEGQPQCAMLLPSNISSKAGLKGDFWPLENHDGFLNNETVGQFNGGVVTNVGSIPFTGTAQIECAGV